MALNSSPPSRTSSRSSRKSLTLDLSSLPPLIPATPPSNTLLFTNLTNPSIFRPDNLHTIHQLILQTASTHTFAPLTSFRRIIISFYTEEAAIAVRSIWDGEAIMGEKCRVYFGTATKIDDQDAEGRHLALPDAGKLFFISPPPSPPHDWEMRLEGAPNKQVHAEDLASALAKLGHDRVAVDGREAVVVGGGGGGGGITGHGAESPVTPGDREGAGAGAGAGAGFKMRSRSSTLIFSPLEGGSGPQLPSIAVDDTTQDVDDLAGLLKEAPIMAHTARPPVELM